MTQITMKELKNIITDKIEDNIHCEYYFITINGVSINCSTYNIIELENDYFTIDFFHKGHYTGSFRCWQTPHTYIDEHVYEIV